MGKFLTNDESPNPVYFSAAPDWLARSNCSLLRDMDILVMTLYYGAACDGFRHLVFSCTFLVVRVSPTRTGELNSHHPQGPVWVESCTANKEYKPTNEPSNQLIN
jgi:hypothetical protein